MNIQRFIAPTSREALDKARAVFGENTLILSNRPTANGVEVMATSEDVLDQGSTTSPGLRAAIQAREADETRAPKPSTKPDAAQAKQPCTQGQPSPDGCGRHRAAGHEHAVFPELCARAHAAPSQ